jgi:hypothetical protein
MLGGEDVSYHVILPEPPILVQEPQHHERAVLFSAVYHAPLNVAIQGIARFSLSQVDPVDSLENAEVPDQAWHRPLHGFGDFTRWCIGRNSCTTLASDAHHMTHFGSCEMMIAMLQVPLQEPEVHAVAHLAKQMGMMSRFCT